MIDRSAIFRGELAQLAVREESIALARLAMSHATRAMGDDLRDVHDRFDASALWTRTCEARASLANDVAARDAVISLAMALGFRRNTLAIDPPRLRVVAPRMHETAAAKRAFYMHRDTWYGSPRAQINVWIPLFDVDERDSMVIHTRAFGVRVENDSNAFDYDRFSTRGGFQSAAVIDAAYPRCLSAVAEGHRVRARANEIIAFSAAHLHGTTPNDTDHTRFSVDVRLVDLDDDARGVGAPDDDNASRGSALRDYFRVTS